MLGVRGGGGDDWRRQVCSLSDCEDGLMSVPSSLQLHLVLFIVRQSHLTKAVKKKP